MIAQIIYFDLLDDLDVANSKKFITEKVKEFGGYDIFETSNEVELKNHYHEDRESRFILQGICFFNIKGKQVRCGPGTYVELSPRVEHSFYCDSQEKLKVLRFFGTNSRWEAVYTDN